MQNALKIILIGLIFLGLYGAVKVSYTTFSGGKPCPSIAGFYICYLVLFGYCLMVIGHFLRPCKKTVFYIGWFIVFLIALLGTTFEITQGNTCPQSSSGWPLCYVSLLISMMIGLLFWFSMRIK